MDNKKDKNEIMLNSQGQESMSFMNPFINKYNDNKDFILYDTLNKKTEKLVTAVYMVTDCIDSNDALKNNIRTLCVELLSDMYSFAIKKDIEKHIHMDYVLNHIKEIVSCVSISCSIGFISEMNALILKREFNFLMNQLESHQSKNGHFSFTLDESVFLIRKENDNKLNSGESILKDNSLIDKKFEPKKMSLIKDQKIIKDSSVSFIKNDRQEKIIAMMINKKELTIKDISSVLKDCSEKTLQRELNNLISKGQIKKTGSKRWSKYVWVG